MGAHRLIGLVRRVVNWDATRAFYREFGLTETREGVFSTVALRCTDSSVLECVVRRCDAEHVGDTSSRADIIGDSFADDQRGNSGGVEVQSVRNEFPGDVEPG